MRWCASLLVLVLSACASTHAETPSGPPSLVAAAAQPAPPQARFYADCIAQAAQAGTYDRETNTLRFHCNGAPASAFYAALANWSVAHNAQLEGEGRMWRFTQRPEHDISGLDHCWQTQGGDQQTGCTIVLNVGEFLAQP